MSRTVPFFFAEGSTTRPSEVNVNFQYVTTDLDSWSVQSTGTTISDSADVDGPSGKTILLLVRDSTNGGNALILYETGQTPVIVSNIAGAGSTFVTGAPGAGQIQVKDGTGKITFRAAASTAGAVLKTISLIAEA